MQIAEPYTQSFWLSRLWMGLYNCITNNNLRDAVTASLVSTLSRQARIECLLIWVSSKADYFGEILQHKDIPCEKISDQLL